MIHTLEISLKSFEFQRLEETSKQIEKSLPPEWIFSKISFPRKIKKFTLIRSPHIDKKSREQFEIRTHKMKIFLKAKQTSEEMIKKSMNQEKIFLFLENLKNLHPSGVQIQIEILSQTSL